MELQGPSDIERTLMPFIELCCWLVSNLISERKTGYTVKQILPFQVDQIQASAMLQLVLQASDV